VCVCVYIYIYILIYKLYRYSLVSFNKRYLRNKFVYLIILALSRNKYTAVYMCLHV